MIIQDVRIISTSLDKKEVHQLYPKQDYCPAMSARFRNYPEPREGPTVPYKHEELSLPVLRGPILSLSATM